MSTYSLAEHVAGTPYHYKHGWVPIAAEIAKNADSDTESWRMSHRPPGPDYGAPMHDLGQLLPEDVYTHPQFYANLSGRGAEPGIMESVRAYQSAKGKPDKLIPIYRAVPKEYADQPMRPGDWVTTSRTYAQQHAFSNVGDDGVVIARTAKAKELWQNGDSLNEWGYWPEQPTPLTEEAMRAKHRFPKSLADMAAALNGRVYDLATSVPYYGSGDPNAPTTVQTPPDQNETVQHIAEALLAGYALHELIEALASIVPGISLDIWKPLLDATGGTRGHAAHARLNALELREGSRGGAEVARKAARREIFYRASYLARAVVRVQHDVSAGHTIPEAINDELPNFHAHEAARRNRLDSAAMVGRAAEMHGDLLGWYINPLLNNEPECIAANGHNFLASESTVIGDPGAVHRYCGCVPGPPIEGAGMVNDAIAAARSIRFVEPRRYGLRKAG